MAIVNTAYGTLADPQRRKEHDDWIAQEEYEIELVESTRQDRGARTRAGHDARGRAVADPPAPISPANSISSPCQRRARANGRRSPATCRARGWPTRATTPSS
jgi:curved DNA-binding protein CbpA